MCSSIIVNKVLMRRIVEGGVMSIGNSPNKVNEENLGVVFHPSVADVLQLNGDQLSFTDSASVPTSTSDVELLEIAQTGETQQAPTSDVYAESFARNDSSSEQDSAADEDGTHSSEPINNALSVKAEVMELIQFKPIELDDPDEIDVQLPLSNVGVQFASTNSVSVLEQLFAFESIVETVEAETEAEPNSTTAAIPHEVASAENNASEQKVYLFDELDNDIGIVFFFDEFGKDIVISDFDAGLDTINLEYFTDNSTLLSFLLNDEGFGRATYIASPTDFGRVDIDIQQLGDDVSIEINALGDELLPGVDGIGKTGAYSYNMTILLSYVDVTELEFSDFVY